MQKPFFIISSLLNRLPTYCGLLWLHVTHHNTAYLAKGSRDISWAKWCSPTLVRSPWYCWSSMPKKWLQLVSLISVLLYLHEQFLLQPTVESVAADIIRCGKPTCRYSLTVAAWSLCAKHCCCCRKLSCTTHKFLYRLCFSGLKPRFIFIFWGSTFTICWPVILETLDLLIHRGQRFDLLTSCSAYLLFVLMFFPLLMGFHI